MGLFKRGEKSQEDREAEALDRWHELKEEKIPFFERKLEVAESKGDQEEIEKRKVELEKAQREHDKILRDNPGLIMGHRCYYPPESPTEEGADASLPAPPTVSEPPQEGDDWSYKPPPTPEGAGFAAPPLGEEPVVTDEPAPPPAPIPTGPPVGTQAETSKERPEERPRESPDFDLHEGGGDTPGQAVRDPALESEPEPDEEAAPPPFPIEERGRRRGRDIPRDPDGLAEYIESVAHRVGSRKLAVLVAELDTKEGLVKVAEELDRVLRNQMALYGAEEGGIVGTIEARSLSLDQLEKEEDLRGRVAAYARDLLELLKREISVRETLTVGTESYQQAVSRMAAALVQSEGPIANHAKELERLTSLAEEATAAQEAANTTLQEENRLRQKRVDALGKENNELERRTNIMEDVQDKVRRVREDESPPPKPTPFSYYAASFMLGLLGYIGLLGTYVLFRVPNPETLAGLGEPVASLPVFAVLGIAALAGLLVLVTIPTLFKGLGYAMDTFLTPFLGGQSLRSMPHRLSGGMLIVLADSILIGVIFALALWPTDKFFLQIVVSCGALVTTLVCAMVSSYVLQETFKSDWKGAWKSLVLLLAISLLTSVFTFEVIVENESVVMALIAAFMINFPALMIAVSHLAFPAGSSEILRQFERVLRDTEEEFSDSPQPPQPAASANPREYRKVGPDTAERVLSKQDQPSIGEVIDGPPPFTREDDT